MRPMEATATTKDTNMNTIPTTTTVKVSELEVGERFVHPTIRNYSEVVFEGLTEEGLRYSEIDGPGGWVLLGWGADDEVKVVA